MKFGLFTDPDTTRFCGLRLRRLKEAIKDRAILDAVAPELDLPAGAALAAIEKRIDERAAAPGLWHDVPPPEVLAALIFKARGRAGGAAERLFCQVASAQDLVAPLLVWMGVGGLTPYAGAAISAGQPYVVGYRDGTFGSGGRLAGFAPVNDPLGARRALDDMRALRDRMSAFYLVCTPALVAEYQWSQAREAAPRWDADALGGPLRKAGIGLLIVEGDALAQAIIPTEHKPPKHLFADQAARLQAQGRIRG